MDKKQQRLAAILNTAPVVPVIVIDDLAQAVPLASALVKAGLTVLEITLRTPVAFQAMKVIMAEVEGAIVGAGTVLSPHQFEQVDKLGVSFAVSPGATAALLKASQNSEMPLLPGGVTATECMCLWEQGFIHQKFFPAEPAGGVAYLASLAAPLPDIRFCPTGGINAETALTYLKLKNVITIGGSWMLPKQMIAVADWAGIGKLAAEAAALKA